MTKDLTYGKNAWKNLKKDRLAMAGLFIILMAVIISVLGYLITPDNTPFCNEQFLELAARKPGLKVRMLKVTKNESSEKPGLFSRMIYGKRRSYYLIPFKSLLFEDDMVIINGFSDYPGDEEVNRRFNLADVIFAISVKHDIEVDRNGNLFFYDINGMRKEEQIERLQQVLIKEHVVVRHFLLGTDRFGRDLLSRLVMGTRISLSVGLISVIISLIIGLTLGAVAGYFRGRVDEIIMWLINVVWSIPTLLMVISLTLVLGKGFWQVFVAVGLTMWVEVARIVRGQVISLREKEFIEAARALGFRSFRILSRHIIPNVINPVIIISAANFASAILIEAGLSFLGIGVQPPVPSWGTMIRDHYGYIIVDKAYLAFLPGIAIMIMVLSFTLVGNGLRDALDVRERA